ncbi:glycosyltransferase family protein [Geomonas propionica]|uniref:Tetratricopeptide repeat protein n=1 Tax=Geomonas propionica TaxID=2798582 RepID=A0ABS0YMN9_9BACT|nr:hypothetical protein [Geomonas propionica]MBJ6799259.1 hypothetical protein [Geomonas propionica]
MKLQTRYQILILAAIVLCVYYPALSAGTCSVDDPRIIAAYDAGAGKTLIGLFRPNGTYYYRPLVELSYYLDNLLWSMHPRFMHLENVLFHALNTMLLFLIGRQLAAAWSIKAPWFPLAGALLFAVHPINTEPVTWIAGRTDPLAAVFVFAALWCLLQCLSRDRLLFLCPALLLFVMGVLTKEIAVCFLPAALLLTACWPSPVRSRRTVLLVLAGVAACSVLLLLILAALSPTLSVSNLLSNQVGGPLAALQTVLSALGFYLKKLVLPLPLNFAIDAVSALYLVPAILLLLLLPFWLKKRSMAAVLVAAGVVFLLPALVVSLGHVAWTPFAERYLYLPSAFLCLGVASQASVMLERANWQQFLLPAAVAIAVVAGSLTMQRTFVWQNNLALFGDTVRKSPGFAAAHLELGVALLLKGELQQGRSEIETAERLNDRPSIRSLIKQNLMAVRLQGGDGQGAREYFFRNFASKEQAGPEFLQMLTKADEGLARQAANAAVRDGMYRDIIATYRLLYLKTRDPFNLYQSGKMAQTLGDRDAAMSYFRQAVREAPADTHYRAAAVKMLQRLEDGQ